MGGLYARYVADKKVATVNKAIRSIIAEIGAHNILSITSDNGTEFKRVPEKRLKHALSEINNMPRKKYDGASSIEYSQLLTSQKKLA